MRRPFLLIFLIILAISFLVTKRENNINTSDKMIEITGVVKYFEIKEKYIEFQIDEYLIRDYTKNSNIKVGYKLDIKGNLKNLDNMKYENFDYGRYLKSKGYKGLVYLNSYDINGKNKFYSYIDMLKTKIEHNFKYLYKENSGFINSLLLNIRSSLSLNENDMLMKTGTTHVISISGLHIGILCGALVFIIGKINKIHKFLIIVMIMIFYSFLVGNIPSMKRAIFFTIVAYLAFFLDKKVDGISTLSFIGTFLVIENPYIIYNLSFQLSFLATLSIIYFYDYINNVIKINLLSLTIAANILTLPIVYYNFKIISIISIISNIIVVPLIGVIIYIAISSLVMFEFNIELAKNIAFIGNTIIDFIYFILNKMANIKFAYIEVDNPNIYYIIIYYVIVFSYMIYNEMKTVKEQKNELQGYYKQYKV